MNPIVEAALIAGGASLVSMIGTVVVAVTGIRNARKASAAAVDAAHRDRLWDKQATAYVDAIATLRQRQDLRRRRLETVLVSGPEAHDTSSVKWEEVQDRLLAFASPQVLSMLITAAEANLAAHDRYAEWGEVAWREAEANMAGNREQPVDVTTVPAVIAAERAVRSAIQTADEKDSALMAEIWTDLHRKPSGVTTSAPPRHWLGLIPPDPL